MIKIAICDDETNIVEDLKNIIYKYVSKKNIQYKIFTFLSGVSLIQSMNENYDIVFLDIEMDELNGIETAKLIKKSNKNAIICFITSHGGYVSSAFEIKAFQYLMKPVCENQVFKELDRAIIEYSNSKFMYSINQVDKRSNERYILNFSIDEIIYFESENKKVILHSTKGNFKYYKKLDDVENELNQFKFVRCHKSYLVNLCFVRKIYNNKIIINRNNVQIPISESKKFNTMLTLKKYRENYI